jgi:pimeloyl-ACP methyl ester carboxylesterase
MKSSRSEFVHLRDRRYHIRIWGEDTAPTLFFLHGWGDVSASFQFVVDALKGHWRVIAPDWRGFGLSQWNDGPYWFADYIADLDALLEQYSPQHPVQIAGHSMGGIVASLYAGIRPARVSRFANLEGFRPWIAAPIDTPFRFATWLQQIRDVDTAFRHYPSRAEFASRLRKDNPRLTGERAAFLAEHFVSASEKGFAFAADPRHRWINPLLFPIEEAKACWRRMSAATLLICGKNSDVIKSLAEHPVDYQARMACFTTVEDAWIDDCGHNLHHDQPEKLAHCLETFFTAGP